MSRCSPEFGANRQTGCPDLTGVVSQGATSGGAGHAGGARESCPCSGTAWSRVRRPAAVWQVVEGAPRAMG
jgi:hypothetical protein